MPVGYLVQVCVRCKRTLDWDWSRETCPVPGKPVSPSSPWSGMARLHVVKKVTVRDKVLIVWSEVEV